MKNSLISLLKSKSYVCLLLIAACAAYGYAVFHSAIGIDDTAIPLYFQKGLVAYMHRWGLYLFIHLFHIPAEYGLTALVDGISVLILCVSATIWCALWKWLLDPVITLSPFHYSLIAALFVTNPIISEVFIYFLHNGICIGYGLTGLALYLFLLSTGRRKWKTVKTLIPASLLLSIAVASYESFLLVFIMGALLIFILVHSFRSAAKESVETDASQGAYPAYEVFPWLRNGVVLVLATLAIYKGMYYVCQLFYDASAFEGYDVFYRVLFGSNFTALSELGITLKRYVSLYHIAGMLYLPIGVLVISRITILLFAVVSGFRRKNLWIILSAAVLWALPPIMAVVEGNVTKYRTAQYVPMLCSFTFLLMLVLIKKKNALKKTPLSPLLVTLLLALILWQSLDMNKWFMIDYTKNEDAAAAMTKVAEDLQSGDYDLSKPLVFVGAYRVPGNIAKQGMIPYDSRRFYLLSLLTDPIDVHWKEKFYSAAPGLGYVYNSTPQESILQWGTDAFNHTDEQAIRFLEMLGYPGFVAADKETNAAGEDLQKEMQIPSIYSGETYIYETDSFLMINIAAN